MNEDYNKNKSDYDCLGSFCVACGKCYCLFSFMKISVNTEGEALQQKANNIIQQLNIHDSSEVIDRKLTLYLTNHSFIRIIQPNSLVVHEVTNDHQLTKKIKGKFSRKQEIKRYSIKLIHKEEQILVVRVPIKTNGQPVATLEIGKNY